MIKQLFLFDHPTFFNFTHHNIIDIEDWSNSELISGCKEFNPEARRVLYEKYSAQMYSICMRYANNKDDANDIFQQGFYLVYKNIAQIRDPKAMSGWIKRIFVNAALDHFKKNKRSTALEENQIESNENLNDWNDAISNLAAEEITALIQKLPNAYRTVFNLYVIDNMSHKEIADKLSISEGTSKSNLHDARKILKRKIISLNKINLSLT